MSEDVRPNQLSLSDISSGVDQVEKVKKPSLRDQLAKAQEDHRTAILKNNGLQAQIDTIVIGNWLRMVYSGCVFSYLVAYSVCVYLLISRVGSGSLKLPSGVLIAAAGSTAVAAIGLVSQIGKGLFPSK